MKITLSNEEIGPDPEIEAPKFPKYATIILNRANRYSQGTRPRVVGKMTELFKVFPGKTLDEWERWYVEQKPGVIEQATEKILGMVKGIQGAIEKIDRDMVETWARDLIIVKTFKGLRFQKAILKKGAELINRDFRLAEREEESKGIDGYIGDMAVSIKPITYRLESDIEDTLPNVVIYYEELEDGIEVDYSELTK